VNKLMKLSGSSKGWQFLVQLHDYERLEGFDLLVT
jgi:hypothetical protein